MSFRILLRFKTYLISLLSRIQGYQIIFLLSQNFFFLLFHRIFLCVLEVLADSLESVHPHTLLGPMVIS